MKTAEEWAEEWIGPDFNKDSMLVAKFKQIQFDAWKQGMTDAATEVRTHWNDASVTTNIKAQAERSSQVLLSIANKKTSI